MEEIPGLTENFADILSKLLSSGFEPPIWLATISLNGCALTVRYDQDPDGSGFSATVLSEHFPEPTMQLPINLMCVDSRGEAARVVIKAEELHWVEVD